LLTASTKNARGVPLSAVWMLAIGGLGYPVWAFTLLLAVSGLARVVGDNLMLGEPITFRGCISAVRRRLGAITLMGLSMIVLLLVAYVILAIILFIVIMGVGLIVGATAAAGLPQWLTTVALVVTVISALALLVFLACFAVAHVVFQPQIVMIEGESAVNALGRAFSLGKRNWYRVAAIVLFTYFVQFSILTALTLPALAGLYLYGVLNTEFFVSPLWTILYTSFGDIANLLSLPIWIVSFTLLYFDSRVRKEAYDVDLLAREINPGFFWQPPVQTSPFGYQMPTQPGLGRAYVQTSPLGLAGYRPPSRQPEQTSPVNSERPAHTEQDDLRDKFERAAESLSAGETAVSAPEQGPQDAVTDVCKACGAPLMERARFCMRCGSSVRSVEN
jgi:hypothetical protein